MVIYLTHKSQFVSILELRNQPSGLEDTELSCQETNCSRLEDCNCWIQWIRRNGCVYRKEGGCVGFVILRYHAVNEATERAASAPIVGYTTSQGANTAKQEQL